MEKLIGRPKLFLSVFFILLIPILLLLTTGFRQSMNTILSINPLSLMLAFLLCNIPVLLHSYTWKKSLEIIDIQFSFRDILELNLSHLFVNNLTPLGYSGGEPTVAYFLSRRTEKSIGKILSAILAANTINFLPIVSMISFGAVLSSPAELLGLSLSALALREKVEKELEDLKKGFKLIFGSRKTLRFPILIVHLSIITNILAFIVIGDSVNVVIDPLPMLLILPIARFSSYFPTPGGSGAYEVTLISLLILFYDFGAGKAAVITLIFRSLTFYFGLVAGYVAFSREGFRQLYLD